MKKKLKFLPWFILLFLIAELFIAPLSSSATEPLVIGVLHSEAYPYATMMKNSFEMALEEINRDGKLFLTHTKIGELYTLRMIIGQTYVEEKDVELALGQIAKAAEITLKDRL